MGLVRQLTRQLTFAKSSKVAPDRTQGSCVAKKRGGVDVDGLTREDWLSGLKVNGRVRCAWLACEEGD